MKIVIRTVKFILDVLPGKDRMKLFIVFCLLFVNSFLDLLGLGALIPVFTVLLEDNVIEKYAFLRWIYDILSLTNENQLIVILAIVLFVIVVIKNIIGLLIIKYNSKFALGLSKEFTLRLHKLYYKKGFSFFKTTNSNVVVRNLRAATNQFANIQVLGTLNFLNEVIVLTFIVGGIALYNFKILLLLLVTVLPPFIIFYMWVRKRSVELGEISNRIGPIIGKNLFQSIFGFVDVKIMGAENDFRNKIEDNLDDLVDVDIKTNVYNLAPTRVIESSIMLAVALIVSFGIYYLPSKIELLKLLGLFAIAGYRIMPSINRMMIAINGLNRSYWVLNVLGQLKNDQANLTPVIEEEIVYNKHLKLENVYFTYPGSTDPVLENINLTIKKGEVIGLVGPSGAGKTTLMNILLGFLTPTKGNYFIDDTILDVSHEKSFYNKIGYVQQQVYLIDGTIAENVAFGCKHEEVNQEKLNEALNKANLLGMLSNLPEGVNEIIGENGTKLSGGQRQRIGIARALYFDSDVIFLDEATSSLDSKTEKDITDSIQSLSDDRLTIIIIAHRLSTLAHCNRIFEIKDKKIVNKELDFKKI
ncbi:ABC transporter ATP-binding protein [Winogradskyella wichelsiae]|uniref:ABC transporter ATP-binding protein n=1 Tax=Winogradskyella wichelsiae TaxID=2697007 RepID=UPI0015C7E6AB|nr:ABC transporter ATP-binding protein [Winogradskyella wichelsiae]